MWEVIEFYPYEKADIVGPKIGLPRTAAMKAWQRELCEAACSAPDNKQTFLLCCSGEGVAVQFCDFAVYIGKEVRPR